MSKVSISEAARLTGKPRSTIHRHIKKGKLSVQKKREGKSAIDVVELERVYGELQQVDMKQSGAIIQFASPNDTAVDREELATLRRETILLREQLDDIRQDRDHWRKQATALLTDQREKSADEPLTLWQWLGLAKR